MATPIQPPDYVILGAGVVGLTTALELKERFPQAEVVIMAKFVPGDRSVEYTSPWAGANWQSMATDNGPAEVRDALTYRKFDALSKSHPHCGIKPMVVRTFYDSSIEDAGVLSDGTGKVWYEELVGGLRWLEKEDLKGAVCGYEFDSWMVDTGIYLAWLYTEVLRLGVQIRRQTVLDINDLLTSYPSAKALFNCSGLGSYHLKGVEDHSLYPTRGQIVLISNPTPSLNTMSTRSPRRIFKDTTYVFPRNPGGGVILGGCRLDGNWDGVVDEEFAVDIIRRCLKLEPGIAPGLKGEEAVEDVKERVLFNGVGLRPSRKGGVRVERQAIDKRLVVHNYGAAGAGFQSSWGLAKDAVDLLGKDSKL